MRYYTSIRLNRDEIEGFEHYPYSIPAIRNLEEITLNENVTFVVGENGTGKSTNHDQSIFNTWCKSIYSSSAPAKASANVLRFFSVSRTVFRGHSNWNPLILPPFLKP